MVNFRTVWAMQGRHQVGRTFNSDLGIYVLSGKTLDNSLNTGKPSVFPKSGPESSLNGNLIHISHMVL